MELLIGVVLLPFVQEVKHLVITDDVEVLSEPPLPDLSSSVCTMEPENPD